MKPVIGCLVSAIIAPAAVLACLLLFGCATTTLYGPDRMPLARFQGDMTDFDYARSADGSVRWHAATIDHSAATTAGGQAAALNFGTTGTAASAVLLAKP